MSIIAPGVVKKSDVLKVYNNGLEKYVAANESSEVEEFPQGV